MNNMNKYDAKLKVSKVPIGNEKSALPVSFIST